MRSLVACMALGGIVAATTVSAQTAPAGGTDLYHVHFTKAAPGQAAALGKALMVPDKTSPMPEHFVVLRHQEGDDWDFAVIEHLGAKTELTAVAAGGPDPARNLSAWHNDTFVTGPSWGDFSREMGLGASAKPGAVYIVGVHRPVAGHRDQLERALNAPAPSSSKVQSGNVLLTHREGGEWTFATITRYDSWSDLASDRSGAASDAPGTAGGWADIREHSAFHRDTIADRLYPAK